MQPFAGLRRTACLAAISVFVPFVAGAADWPGYRGPEGTGRTPEKIHVPWPAAGPRVVWKVPSKGGFSSFAVVGNRAHCLELRDVSGAEQEVLAARDATSGTELWAKPLGTVKIHDGGDDGTPNNKGGDGPRSSPAADGSRVYAFSSRLVLSAFDASSGNEVWKHDLLKEFEGRNISWQNAQSPVLEGGKILVSGGGAGQSLLAFDAATGNVVWKGFDETSTHATAVVGTIAGQRQAVFFLKSGLLSVNPKTGAELWRYSFPFRTSTAASPVISGDIVYCSAGYGVGAGAVRVSKTGTAWTATEIYRKAGNVPLANHWSTPVLNAGHLYGMFQFKEYGTGPVKCVEIATGNVKWEKAGFGPGQVIGSGPSVLALTDAGELVVFAASPKAYEELARAKVLDGKCWTTPVIAGNRVYARSTKEAVCVELPR